MNLTLESLRVITCDVNHQSPKLKENIFLTVGSVLFVVREKICFFRKPNLVLSAEKTL